MTPLRLILLGCLALLASCQRKQEPAPAPRVALWEIADASGARGWLFGTVHALPPGTRWMRPAIAQALAASDRLVFEIAEPLDPEAAGAALSRLAYTDGLPPPSQRIAITFRDDLTKVYNSLSVDDATFRNEESWAVALQLAAIAGQKEGIDPDSGAEPELRRLAGRKPVTGLETIDSQFGIFDKLAPRQQTVLLEQVTLEAASERDEDRDMLSLWLRGDDLGIAQESRTGFLADPALHEALLTARNRDWTGQIDTLLRQGAKPFIAVGAAHVAGSDGLPRMLEARGWKVRRVQ